MNFEQHITPFMQHLFRMDDRINTYHLGGDIEDKKFFFVDKRRINIPVVVPSAEHEVCHLVEMNNSARWTMPDFGLALFLNSPKKASTFFAALARETRVRAINLHLLAVKERDYHWDRYIKYHRYWSDEVKNYLPFGRFQSKKDIEQWIERIKETTFSRWSVDRIEHEWKIRLHHIQCYMESN